MNAERRNSSLLPYFIGFSVVAMLAGLGVWQISRGLEKQAGRDAFNAATGTVRYDAGADTRPFQPLRVRGVFDADRQLLLDNAIVDSRNGHFVITPLRLDGSDALLLVNRGWIPRGPDDEHRAAIALDEDTVSVTGRVGRLPKAGMRMGDPFAGSSGWPRHAVFPALADVEALLGEPLEPFVLLLDPAADGGFVREWAPEEMSASRHYGYAFQWFAMAAVLAALLTWQRYKRRRG